MSKNGPIFIAGLDRSGKTYMRMMLSAHPHLAFSRRTNLWTKFYERFGDLRRGENFKRCLEAMLSDKHIRQLNPDPNFIQQEFWQGEPTYSRLFSLLHEVYAEREGKLRWGDQTELVERYAAQIFAAYPGARMIHLLRDPRDQMAASAARGGRGPGRAGRAVVRWLTSANLALRNQESFPDQYKIIRYETMVACPEKTLQCVCEFIGETFYPDMVTLEGEARFRKWGNADSKGRQSPLTTAFIGHYRGKITRHEIFFIQKAAGKEMQAFGYSPDPIQFSYREKLRFFLVDWPVNLATSGFGAVRNTARWMRPG